MSRSHIHACCCRLWQMKNKRSWNEKINKRTQNRTQLDGDVMKSLFSFLFDVFTLRDCNVYCAEPKIDNWLFHLSRLRFFISFFIIFCFSFLKFHCLEAAQMYSVDRLRFLSSQKCHLTERKMQNNRLVRCHCHQNDRKKTHRFGVATKRNIFVFSFLSSNMKI